jgi:L-ascorbate metabolism protein UlaG (beta-lactamase superfamily)
MKITSYGHCCLLIEEQNVRILTDPGTYSEGFEKQENLDLILITHEHPDHMHIPALKELLIINPQAEVVTNEAVAALLAEAGISYILMTDKEVKTWKDVTLEAYEAEHAVIYPNLPRVQNTGFFIAETLFYPGDALIQPNKPVDVLALPVVGPWIKISEAVEYALAVHPRVAFPVHDGILKVRGLVHRVPSQILPENGIAFEVIEQGETKTF